MARSTVLVRLLAALCVIVLFATGCSDDGDGSSDEQSSQDATDDGSEIGDAPENEDDPAETTTTTITVPEPSPEGTFADWSAEVSAACRKSSADAAAVTEESGSKEALVEFAIITSEESVAIENAGLPAERTDDAREWRNLHATASNLYLQIAAEGRIDPLDERTTQLQGYSAQLSQLSSELGIEGCVGQQAG